MFKVNKKNPRTSYETYLKLKLKNKYTKLTLSNGVLRSLLLRTFFLFGSSVFTVDFKHLNDKWECCERILTVVVAANIYLFKVNYRNTFFLCIFVDFEQVNVSWDTRTINSSGSLTRTR